MFFPLSLITLIATSSLINALPQDPAASPLPTGDACAVTVYIGENTRSGSGIECRVTTTDQNGQEEMISDNTACDQTNFNYATNGATPTSVKDFTVSQTVGTCNPLGGYCYPTLTMNDGTSQHWDMVKDTEVCSNGGVGPDPLHPEMADPVAWYWKCKVDCK